MVSFCERNVWTGPFCIGLPKLFVSVLFGDQVSSERFETGLDVRMEIGKGDHLW